jgi:uncharacterized membrane protein
MSSKDPHPHHRFFKNFERVLNFTDCVFSFCITVMVLSLTVPVIAKNDVSTELTIRLINEWPTFLIYTISFIIIGTWWMNHHQIFQHITKADRILLCLNLLFLLCITLIPFQTSLIIQYPESQVAVIFYALTQAFAGFVFVALWYYATKDRRFSDPDLPQVTVHYFIMRELLISGVFLISIGIAFFNTYIAELSWIFIGILIWWVGKRFYKEVLPVGDQTE